MTFLDSTKWLLVNIQHLNRFTWSELKKKKNSSKAIDGSYQQPKGGFTVEFMNVELFHTINMDKRKWSIMLC